MRVHIQMNHAAVCTAEQTEALLPFPDLIEEIASAAQEIHSNDITAPSRQVVPYPNGGEMLSMPATAQDIGVHKLVNVIPSNKALNIPTINGIVTIYDAGTGRIRLLLDGPTVTKRRTAAVSMLGLQLLHPDEPRHAVIFGTGTQADGHVQALQSLYPKLHIDIIGRTLEKAKSFVKAQESVSISAASAMSSDADLVVTTTSSATPVYNAPANPQRLIIAVGAYRADLAEIGPETLAKSHLYVDDIVGARHEAGDFIQTHIDWSKVHSLAQILRTPHRATPAVFKTVGCSAWDLAAARCALKNLKKSEE